MSEENNKEKTPGDNDFAAAVKKAAEEEAKRKAAKAESDGQSDTAEAETDAETNKTESNEESVIDDNDDEAADSDDSKTKKKNSGFLKKKDKKDKKDEKIAELNDRILRNMAEFDNFRKRSEKEKSQMFEIGAKSIIEKILPVLDNFERGFQTLTEEEKSNAFVQGMEKIYKQMTDTLAEAGVTAIEAVGKEFDPNLHNAIMHEDNEELGENIISQEFQKGYMYRDSVVRHSMVKVAN